MFKPTNTQDVGQRFDFADYQDFSHFLAEGIAPAVREDFRRWKEANKNPEMLPDNGKYFRAVYNAERAYGYEVKRPLERLFVAVKITDDMPEHVRAMLKRLQTFDGAYAAKGRFQRIGDLITAHDYLADNWTRFENAFNKAVAE